MNPECWDQVKTLLAGALEQPDAAARDRYLAVHCGDGRTTLRLEVESLLAQPTDSLETCAGGGMARTLTDPETSNAPDSNVGRRVGAWQLGERLGVGGMGAVYLARRASRAFEQTAAVKLLKRGTDTEEVLRRFRAERQILARLEHPNIARLLDGGETDDGLPFFVIEHVVGEPVTRLAHTAGLSVTGRLELFLKICAAVQYAHQNLVVHRDLKPGNILVTSEGEPKLLDFGIAKLLEEDGGEGESGDHTLAGHGRLTPAYASPEQARGETVTTASDVYALGALLYELLTGRGPHRFSSSRPAPVELARVVGEQPPLRPSLAASDPVAGNRLRGDLDVVLLKALEKQPARRYPTVSALADDVRRHLDGRPVRARPDTLGYRTAKFIGRNKIAVTAGALVLLALLGAMVATTTQRNRAQRERQRAETSEYHSHRLLYAAQMNLAYQAWEGANVGRALDLLEGGRPKPGQEDLRGFEWHLLWRLTHARWRVLRGALAEMVENVDFSPDGGRIIVATTRDGKATVWDVATGEPMKSFDASGAPLALTPGGKFLLTGSTDGSARLWEWKSGRSVRTFTGHKASVVSVAISPDGQTLATASLDGTVRIWSVSTGQSLVTLPGHDGAVIRRVAFSPDGKTLATCSQDHTAKLWDTKSGQEITTLRGHAWYVLDVAFAPDGKTLATTGSDGEIKLWDTASHQETGTIHGDGTTISRVRFSPDGRWLAAATDDSTVRLYEGASGKLSDTLRGHTDNVEAIAFSPDGKTLASGGVDRTVRLWDLTKSPGALSLSGHHDWVSAIAFSPDGRTLASASKDATVKMWDVAAGREVMTLPHPQWVNGCAFSPDGTRLATADDDALVRLWNPSTGENTATLPGHNAVVECVAFSPDGKTLASGGKNGEIKLWETATNREIASFHASAPDLVWSLAFSPDGKQLAVAEGSATSTPRPHAVTVWALPAQRVIATLPGHTSDVGAVAFSPDGKTLASGSWDGTIKLWSVAGNYRERVTLKGQRGVHALNFSADGKRLVSAGSDRTVKLWDLTVGQELCTLSGDSEVQSAAFSPDNGTLAAGSKDGVVRLWRAAVVRADGQGAN